MNSARIASPVHILISRIITALLWICIVTAIAWGIFTYYRLDRELYTDDAQIGEYINPVNTRVTGYVKSVLFTEYQRVKKGDTLVLIDDREFRVAVEQAEAAWLAALASKTVTASAVATVHSNLHITEANIRAFDAQIWNAEQNYRRFENLLKVDAATQQELDLAKTQYVALKEQRSALERQKTTTEFSTDETNNRIPVNDAEIKRAHAALDLARLKLSYTVITAPYDGVTGRRTIQEGQAVEAGQDLVSFVRGGSKWVVANYKETQITRLHLGEKMVLTVDGIDNKQFEGTIEAISQATGARFSAIPVDNATGNFVKVRQRIPVRIQFIHTADSDLDLFVAGMNVEVRVAQK